MSSKKHPDTELPPVDAAVIEERILKARVSLLLHHPFFGNMVMRMNITPADKWCKRTSTNGLHFFYNTRYIESCTVTNVVFDFAHQTLHNIHEHSTRVGSRNKELFDIAAEYVVNQILIDENIGKPAGKYLYDKKFKNWTTEEVYEYLKANASKLDIPDLKSKMVDDHLPVDGVLGDGSPDDLPVLSESEREEARKKILNDIIESAQSVGAGNIPLGIARFINDLTEPKMNWRDIIRSQINSLIQSTCEYRWDKWGKKGRASGFFLPELKGGDHIDICIGIDNSGSISKEDLTDFLSEIQGIMQQYSSYKIHVWAYDACVYNPTIYESGDGQDITEYTLAGGGGTRYECNYEHMENDNISPLLFINFTDGYPGGSWGNESFCETIFVIKGNPKATAPFGVTVHLE